MYLDGCGWHVLFLLLRLLGLLLGGPLLHQHGLILLLGLRLPAPLALAPLVLAVAHARLVVHEHRLARLVRLPEGIDSISADKTWLQVMYV